jgi:hypothetical protein
MDQNGVNNSEKCQKRPLAGKQEQGTEALALIERKHDLPTTDARSDTHLHHRKKPFEFYHLAYRKKLTAKELAP